MNDLLLTILEKLSNQQVSLNPQGEICVGDVCRSAYDWLKSIIALENSNSSEMIAVIECVHKTPNIEKKIEKIAFLQCNSTTCWAATAVMLAKYHVSSIKDENERNSLMNAKNEQEYLGSKLPSITYKEMSYQINELERSQIRQSYGDRDPLFAEMLTGASKIIAESFIELRTVLFRTIAQEDDNIPNDLLAKIFYIATRVNIVDELFPQTQINHGWLKYYAEAFYDPENRKGNTTLAPGLQLNQVDNWFKGMMKFDIDKFDGNNRRLNEFTLQYLAEKLLNGPVIINMPSEIIEEEISCKLPVNGRPCLQEGMDISDCVLCAMKGYTHFDPYNDGTHYVMFYGMTLPEQEKEVYCQYVETIYYDNKSGLICDGSKKFRHNSISWVTLQTWMTQHYKEKLKHDPFVIYKETNK